MFYPSPEAGTCAQTKTQAQTPIPTPSRHKKSPADRRAPIYPQINLFNYKILVTLINICSLLDSVGHYIQLMLSVKWA